MFEDRIVGHAKVKVADILFNAANWRIHPRLQKEALRAAIRRVGFLRSVTINQMTGNLVDGHLRVLLADEEGMAEIWAEFVALSTAEEREALLELDPIGQMAFADKEKLTALIEAVQPDDEALKQMLEELALREGLANAGEARATGFQVVIACRDEDEQTRILARLAAEGYACKSKNTRLGRESGRKRQA